MATTRLQIFKDIADELGDLVELTATADGSTTAFISTNDMVYADSGLNGREVWYASAHASSTANLGTRRVAVSTTFDDSTVQVFPAWPAITKAGDTILLINASGTGVTIPEIHRKINQLLRRISDSMSIDAVSTAASFNALSPTIEIPDAWDYLLGIQVEERPNSNVWTTLVGDVYTVNAWDTPKTVTIVPNKRTLLSSRRVRLIGSIGLGDLEEDDDETTAPASWLAKTAAYELIEAVATRSGDVATAFTYGEMLKQSASELKGYVNRRYRPAGKRVALRR